MRCWPPSMRNSGHQQMCGKSVSTSCAHSLMHILLRPEASWTSVCRRIGRNSRHSWWQSRTIHYGNGHSSWMAFGSVCAERWASIHSLQSHSYSKNQKNAIQFLHKINKKISFTDSSGHCECHGPILPDLCVKWIHRAGRQISRILSVNKKRGRPGHSTIIN